MAVKRIEYMCSHCGKKETRFVSMGRPQPGKCPRKNGDKPTLGLLIANLKIKFGGNS